MSNQSLVIQLIDKERFQRGGRYQFFMPLLINNKINFQNLSNKTFKRCPPLSNQYNSIAKVS